MEQINCRKIPNLLRRYRKARGLRQNQVAAILGLKSASVISRWEKGTRIPSTVSALELSAIYRTMVNVMFPKLDTMLRARLRKREEDVLKKVSLNRLSRFYGKH